MATAQTPVGPDSSNVFEAAAWEVSRGKRVLDVASGPGYVAAACAVRGADVVGVDVVRELALSLRDVPGRAQLLGSETTG